MHALVSISLRKGGGGNGKHMGSIGPAQWVCTMHLSKH